MRLQDIRGRGLSRLGMSASRAAANQKRLLTDCVSYILLSQVGVKLKITKRVPLVSEVLGSLSTLFFLLRSVSNTTAVPFVLVNCGCS